MRHDVQDLDQAAAVERTLTALNRRDAEEQRVEVVASGLALAFIVGIFAVPTALSWLAGWSWAWVWIVGGVLGSAPLWGLLRRLRERRLLARSPLPTVLRTSIWLGGDAEDLPVPPPPCDASTGLDRYAEEPARPEALCTTRLWLDGASTVERSGST